MQLFPCLLGAYHAAARVSGPITVCDSVWEISTPILSAVSELPLPIAGTLWLCQVIFEFVLYSVSDARSVYSHAQLTPECLMRCHKVLSSSNAFTAKRLGQHVTLMAWDRELSAGVDCLGSSLNVEFALEIILNLKIW